MRVEWTASADMQSICAQPETCLKPALPPVNVTLPSSFRLVGLRMGRLPLLVHLYAAQP